MKFVSCLAAQMPWLTLNEFEILKRLQAERFSFSEWHTWFEEQSRTALHLKSSYRDVLGEASRLDDECAQLGVEVIYPGHSLYHRGFYDLEQPPLFLSLLGHWEPSTSLAIVGSREPSRYSIDWLDLHLPEALRKSTLTVISGGARGIDQAAHLSAAKLGRATVVFLPSGLNTFYPRDLLKWKDLILESGGGFVSELPPNVEMRKHHFIKRNRLIVAAADLIFVVEARRRSGSMLTANIARSMSKNICTLPSSPSMSAGQGSLDLIFDGAFPLRDHLDLQALIQISSRRDEESEQRQWRK